jgi:hypothetical protein
VHAALNVDERRNEARMPAFEPVRVASIDGGELVACGGSLVDLGPGGAGVELDVGVAGPDRGEEILLVFVEGGGRRAGRVVGRTGRTMHVAFAASVVSP